MKHINLKIVPKIFYFLLIAIVSLIAVITLMSILGIPKSAQMFVVETGSMEPTIPTGSIVFVSPQTQYQVGDIITYKSNLGKNIKKDVNVTHRVTSVTSDSGDTFYETQGDANRGPDPWNANNLDVLGKVNFHIPYLGIAVGFAKTKLGFVVLILTPAILIIMLEVMNISKAIKFARLKKHEGSLDSRKLYFDLKS